MVTPICLPFDDAEDEDYLSSDPLDDPETDVAGWGATTVTGRNPADILQWLKVIVRDAEACAQTYAERGATLTEKQQVV